MGMVVTVLTDIVHFGIFYPTLDLPNENRFRFSAGMAILSLLLKPASCFFAYQMYRERGGDYNVHFGESPPGGSRAVNARSSQTDRGRDYLTDVQLR